MIDRFSPIWFVVFIILLAGCTAGPTETPGERVVQHNRISFFGDMEVSNGTFSMNGQLIGCTGTAGPDVCQDVSIELYGTEGELLVQYQVGTLEGRLNVSFSSAMIPQYVVLNSPDFWSAAHTTVEYYELRDGDYVSRPIDDSGELPVSVKTPVDG